MKAVVKLRSLVFVVSLILLASTSALASVKLLHFGNTWHGSAWRQYVEERARAFEAQNPDVEIEIITAGGLKEQFLTMHAGGIIPDVTEFILVSGGEVASQGYFTDLRPYFERDSEVSLDNYLPPSREALTWTDGAIWGFPIDLYVTVALYNPRHFAEDGLENPNELGVNWTWEALIDAGKKLTKDQDGDGVYDRMAVVNTALAWSYNTFVRQAGGEMYDRLKDPTGSNLLDPAVERGVQFFVDLHRVHQIADMDFHQWDPAVAMGLGSINFVSGPHNLSDLPEGSEVDIALQPHGPDNSGTYYAANSFQIPKGAQNPDLAWRWIKFLVGSEEAVRSFVAATGSLPADVRVARDYELMMPHPPQHADVFFRQALNPSNSHDPLGGASGVLRSMLDEILTPLIDGEVGVRSALQDLHRRWTALLADESRQ